MKANTIVSFTNKDNLVENLDGMKFYGKNIAVVFEETPENITLCKKLFKGGFRIY